MKTSKHFFAVIIGLMIIQIAFFITGINGEKHRRYENAVSRTSTMVELAIASTESFFNRYLTIFDTVKTLDHFVLQDFQESSVILKKLNAIYPEIINFEAAKQDGNFFASGKSMAKDKTPNVKHLDFFKRILSGEKFVIMEPHQGPVSKEFVTGVATSLVDAEKNINGVIGVSIKFQSLVDHLEKFCTKSGVMVAVSGEKQTFYFISSKLKKISNDFSNHILSGEPQKFQANGGMYVVSTDQIPHSGWDISVVIPVKNSFFYILSQQKELMLLLGLMLITPCLFGAWLYQEKQWQQKFKKEQKELQKSEHRLNKMIEKSPLPMVVTDEKQDISFFNEKFTQLFGYILDDVSTTEKWWEIACPDKEYRTRVQKSWIEAIDKAISNNTDIEMQEWDLTIKDRTKRRCEFYMVPLDKFNLIIMNDITNRKNTEYQLMHAQKMESIGTLAGGIAHDFNNILFPIVGYTEMLLEDVSQENPMQESLKEIYSSALRAKDLVKQILTFSRHEKHEAKLMKIQPILEEALKMIRATIPTTIEIKKNIDSNCDPVIADPTQIHQLIMNILTNAYHSMANNVGQLTVELKTTEFATRELMSPNMVQGGYNCITISDTGEGMDAKTRAKIFEPFFTTKEKGRGTGLGLSVAHGIVEAVNGSIEVYSEIGKGTKFSIYIPVQKSTAKAQLPKTVESLPGWSETILIVDDEENIIKMTSMMLQRMGYKVYSFRDSVKALESFSSDPDKFDLVITDMAMPRMPGDKLAAELIKVRPDIPILLCTGFSDKINSETVKSLGIREVLEKPIEKKYFAQKIRDVLDDSGIY